MDDPSAPAVQSARTSHALRDAAAVFAAATLACLARLAPLGNGDLLWQIRTGEVVLARGGRADVDVFSNAFRGAKVFDHEAAFEALMALLHRLGGFFALYWFNVVAVGVAAGAAIHLARRLTPEATPRILGATLALLAGATRLELRAEWSAVLAIAFAHGLRRERDTIVGRLAPLAIAAIAAPFHGLVLLVAVVPLAHAIEHALAREKLESFVDLSLSVACVATAELVAPGMVGHALAGLASTAFLSHVVEAYTPIHYLAAGGDAMPVLALAVSLVAAAGLYQLVREGRARIADIALILILVLPGLRWIRFAQLATLAALPWVIAGLGRALSPRALLARTHPRIVALLAMVTWAVGAVVVTAPLGFTGVGGFAWTGQPRASVAWLAAHRPNAVLFHPFNFGSYLIYAGYPPRGVLIDPRATMLYPDAHFRKYYAAVSDPAQFEAWNAEAHFDSILLARQHKGTQPLRDYVTRHPGWVFAYEDEVSVVFVRR